MGSPVMRVTCIKAAEQSGTSSKSFKVGQRKAGISNILGSQEGISGSSTSSTITGVRSRRMSQVHFVCHFGHQTIPEDLPREEKEKLMIGLDSSGSESQRLSDRRSSLHFGNVELLHKSAPLCTVQHMFELSQLLFGLKVFSVFFLSFF